MTVNELIERLEKIKGDYGNVRVGLVMDPDLDSGPATRVELRTVNDAVVAYIFADD